VHLPVNAVEAPLGGSLFAVSQISQEANRRKGKDIASSFCIPLFPSGSISRLTLTFSIIRSTAGTWLLWVGFCSSW